VARPVLSFNLALHKSCYKYEERLDDTFLYLDNNCC